MYCKVIMLQGETVRLASCVSISEAEKHLLRHSFDLGFICSLMPDRSIPPTEKEVPLLPILLNLGFRPVTEFNIYEKGDLQVQLFTHLTRPAYVYYQLQGWELIEYYYNHCAAVNPQTR